MTLLQLRYFKAVCEFHSVTKAADELFISRTAISRSINALEQELGIVLFTHTTTGLELTDDGKIIYERINEVLGRICAIEQVAQQLAEGPKRQIVNVGLTPFTKITPISRWRPPRKIIWKQGPCWRKVRSMSSLQRISATIPKTVIFCHWDGRSRCFMFPSKTHWPSEKASKQRTCACCRWLCSANTSSGNGSLLPGWIQ